MSTRTLLRTLTLPYACLDTVYQGDSEVRVYRNELTRKEQVGKRYDTLGLESAVAVREGELLQRIRHDHVVPVFDVAEVSGYDNPMHVIELIMPYYERGSLVDAFEHGERFSVGEAVGLISGAVLGVAELHECHAILHRDLKSANLFLTVDGRLLVGDLGVCIPMDSAGEAEALPNARLYTPPETFITKRVDRRSEIYQIGLALHELATGPFPYADPAFNLEPIAGRLDRGRPGPPPRSLEHAPWVPGRLRRVINKATHVDPDRRFASAKQMGDALTRVRYIDWNLTVDETDLKRWEGSSNRRPDRQFAVEAQLRGQSRRTGRGAWTFIGQQHVTRWQRIVPDEIVAGLNSTQAARFFETIVASASTT